MTQKEYDALYLQVQDLKNAVLQLSDITHKLLVEVDRLQQKTIVVTDLDKDIEKLKLEIQSLKDESEA